MAVLPSYCVALSILMYAMALYILMMLALYYWSNINVANQEHIKTLRTINFLTGIFGPSIVLCQDANIILGTDIISTMTHCFICLSQAIIWHANPQLMIGPHYGWGQTQVLLLLLGMSLISSVLLQKMSRLTNRQTFGKRTKLGSLACDKSQTFLWACENGYLKNVQESSGKDEITQKSPLGYNGAHLACLGGMIN